MPKLAVLGQPISHSRSPAIHNAAFAELGLGNAWSYEAIEVAPDHFAARVRAMPREGFVGANVTVPHKLAALALADMASEAARAIGAANTLSFGGGRVAAENTDASGFIEALPEPPDGKRALVLGAGGSARAVVWALATHGAEVMIWNRTPARAEGLAREFRTRVAKPNRPDGLLQTRDIALIVNATTIGMGESRDELADLESLPVDVNALGEEHQLVDLAYGAVETELVRATRARGAQVVDGLEVLVRQGAASLRIWTGLDPPIEVMRRAARANAP
jgi:shikimate dehydrogenase